MFRGVTGASKARHFHSLGTWLRKRGGLGFEHGNNYAATSIAPNSLARSSDLAAVCILTMPFRLRGRRLNQTTHQHIASIGMFHCNNDKFRCAAWLARVSNQGIVEINTAFRHMWGDPASGSSVAGSYPRRDESDLV